LIDEPVHAELRPRGFRGPAVKRRDHRPAARRPCREPQQDVALVPVGVNHVDASLPGDTEHLLRAIEIETVAHPVGQARKPASPRFHFQRFLGDG